MRQVAQRYQSGPVGLLISLLLFAVAPGLASSATGKHEWLDQGRVGTSSPLSHCVESDGCFSNESDFPLLYLQVVSDRLVVLGLAGEEEAEEWVVGRSWLEAATSGTDGERIAVEGAGDSASVVGFTNTSQPLIETRVYLLLGQPMKDGERYALRGAGERGSAPRLVYRSARLSPAVQTDQVGYWPKARKVGIVGYWLGSLGALPIQERPFEIVERASGKVVFSGHLEREPGVDSWSGQQVGLADFSGLQTPGDYRLSVPGIGRSPPFTIGPVVYEPVFRKLFKAFYYQRNSISISPPWAEERYARPGGIPAALAARIHPAVVDSPLANGEAAGAIRPVSGGWFDAGDYGQYVTNAAPVWYAFALGFDLLPEALQSDALGIPESGNGIPDLLDELDWGMDWLLSMQDTDGGVYSRLAPVEWDASLPYLVTQDRFLFEKTTHATASFAAVTALHARLLQDWDPERARQALLASRAAWRFLETHPQWPGEGERYTNPPGVHAGEYADASATDNRLWAAAELFRTSREPAFLEAALTLLGQVQVDPTRGVNFSAQGLAAYWALVRQCGTVPDLSDEACRRLRSSLVSGADWQLRVAADNPWGAPVHPHQPFLGWGTFGQSSRAVLPLLQAWDLTGEPRYAAGAVDAVHPQLGANPQSLSYITSVGYRWPSFPLSKLSQYDGVDEPLPGIPVNGPHFHLPAIWPATRAVNEAYQPPDSYPPLLRFVDSDLLPPMAEPTVAELAASCIAFALLADAERFSD